MKLYGYSCIPLFLPFRSFGLFRLGNTDTGIDCRSLDGKAEHDVNLDVKDLELIEDALHSVIAKRSNDLITAEDAQNSPSTAPLPRPR